MTWTSSSSSPWQQWRSDQMRERSGWWSSGSWQSPFSWQWLTSSSRTFTRAFMTIFSALLPLVLFCCERCERLSWPTRPTSQFALMRCHWCALWRKRELIETILAIIVFLTFLSVTIQRRERIITVLWVLVKCLPYFVTNGLHRKNSINGHRALAAYLGIVKEDEARTPCTAASRPRTRILQALLLSPVNRYTSHAPFLNAYSCSQFVCTALHSALTLHAWLKPKIVFLSERVVSSLAPCLTPWHTEHAARLPHPFLLFQVFKTTTKVDHIHNTLRRSTQEGGSYPELPLRTPPAATCLCRSRRARRTAVSKVSFPPLSCLCCRQPLDPTP